MIAFSEETKEVFINYAAEGTIYNSSMVEEWILDNFAKKRDKIL